MDKDVYLICPKCQTITEGVGTGDGMDSIKCKGCEKEFSSDFIFSYKVSNLNFNGKLTFNGRLLYIPVELKIGLQ